MNMSFFKYFCSNQTEKAMRNIYLLMLASALWGCASKTETEKDDEGRKEENEEWISTDDFTLPDGMTAEKVSSFPGVVWDIDTLPGVCAPDTLVVWADYDGIRYITNIQALVGRPMKELKLSGNEKIAAGLADELTGVDFKPTAMIISNPYGSLEQMREIKREEFIRKTDSISQMVGSFFSSGGSPEFMRRSLAAMWERDVAEAMDYGETINPFNNGYRAQFASGKINVTVSDASHGLVEVEAYATDPYTLGHQGWTYWTVEICKEPDGYKIKELPALHRKFEKNDF